MTTWIGHKHKSWDFDEKRLHWASVVCARRYDICNLLQLFAISTLLIDDCISVADNIQYGNTVCGDTKLGRFLANNQL